MKTYIPQVLMDVVRQVRVTIPDLPQKIKEAREKDGRSVQVLATLAGISGAYWYQIEQNKKGWISEDVLRGIEKVLGIDLGARFNDLAQGSPVLNDD